jgi:hypothetical protein
MHSELAACAARSREGQRETDRQGETETGRQRERPEEVSDEGKDQAI